MKYCNECEAPYDSGATTCPLCGQGPVPIEGFDAYAPALAYESEGFKPGYFAELAELEAGNFWFRARNALIAWAVGRYAPGFTSFLEVGCGTAFVLSGLKARFPRAHFSGSEIYSQALPFAAQRVPGVTLMQMDARKIPFSAEFDVVAAFDVIEHIKEDDVVLDQMYRALKPGGHLLLTVPQHAWLWSAADSYACHERRYSAPELAGKVRAAGFEIVRSTSFVTLLMPLLLASRLGRRGAAEDYDPYAEYRIGKFANRVLESVLAVERAGIRLGISYPFGGSRLVVATKPNIAPSGTSS